MSAVPGARRQDPTRLDSPGPRLNRLLASLPEEDFEAIAPALEPVTLVARGTLNGAGERLDHAWFPTTAIISLQQVLEGRPSSEVAMVGREGMVGLGIVLGDPASSRHACVHCPGQAWRLPGALLRERFDRSAPLRSILLRQAQALMAQIAQNGVCYRLHSVEQQVCRRLLMSLDRLMTQEVPVTHEALANALGVRREAVTLAACRLLSDGLLRSSRGRIAVLDRPGLERRACECYASLHGELERLLGQGT